MAEPLHVRLLPVPGKPWAQQRTLTVVAICVWAEDRTHGLIPMVAMVQALGNRVADPRWPDDWKGVILQKDQISSFNADNPWLDWLWHPLDHGPVQVWKNGVIAAVVGLYGLWEDLVNGANHWYAPGAMPGGKPPWWAANMIETARWGGHIFLKG